MEEGLFVYLLPVLIGQELSLGQLTSLHVQFEHTSEWIRSLVSYRCLMEAKDSWGKRNMLCSWAKVLLLQLVAIAMARTKWWPKELWNKRYVSLPFSKRCVFHSPSQPVPYFRGPASVPRLPELPCYLASHWVLLPGDMEGNLKAGE